MNAPLSTIHVRPRQLSHVLAELQEARREGDTQLIAELRAEGANRLTSATGLAPAEIAEILRS